MGRTRKSSQDSLGLPHSGRQASASQSAWNSADQQQGTDRPHDWHRSAKDENIQDKELEEIDKYQSLKIGLEQQWTVKIMAIPVGVGALGAEV